MTRYGKYPEVTIANCDAEPIHIPGSIQPDGCLLACDATTFSVLRASANAAALLGSGKLTLIGAGLADVLGTDAVHTIRNAMAKSSEPARPGLVFGLQIGSNGKFDVSAHLHAGVAIIEFRPASDVHEASTLDLARTVIRKLSTETSLDRLLRNAPRLLQLVLNYDRVMIYRFSEDGAGQVVSEAKREYLESFRGQWFPASDIPAQARSLYLKNTIRVVSDSRCERIPIEPVLDASGEPLDLSFASLRSVSPIHCEYLCNMGVAASMSVSIIVGGELWGLIACHNYSPRTLSLAERVNAEMFGDCFSLQVEALVSRGILQASSSTLIALDQLMQGIVRHDQPQEFLRTRVGDLGNLIPSDGVALWLGGALTAQGSAVSQPALRALAEVAGQQAPGRVWATHRLPAHLPGGEPADALIAGALAIPLSQTPGDYLFYFRKEFVETVEWAGDPNKSYDVGPNGVRLTPRESFAIWKETVRGQSVPWTLQSRQAAEAIRVSLMEITLRQSERLIEERRRFEIRQNVLNEELNHRVKNILALIRSLLRQTQDDGRTLSEYADALEGRIMALATAHDQLLRTDDGGSLGDLVNAELSPYRENCPDLHVDGPSVKLNAQAFSVMALVIHELTTNAAKYGALSDPDGKLSVTWEMNAQSACVLNWTETCAVPVIPPVHKGFGSSLIERSIPFDLEGQADIVFAQDGLQARFVIPVRFVTAANRKASTPPAGKPQAAAVGEPLSGQCVLLVEDQLIIAMDAEEALLELGAAEIISAASSEEALEAIANRPPDFAFLDINLGSSTSFSIAEDLMKRGVPILFATGYGEGSAVPDGMGDIPVLRKPYSFASLSMAIGKIFASRTAT